VFSPFFFPGSSRAGFSSGRFSFGQEWDGGGGKSLSFIGVLGQSNEQESHTYRNRFGKTCFFSSDIGPHPPYWAKRPKLSSPVHFTTILRYCRSIHSSPQTLIDLLPEIDKHRGERSRLWLTRHPVKSVWPERPWGVKDLSWNFGVPWRPPCRMPPAAREYARPARSNVIIGLFFLCTENC